MENQKTSTEEIVEENKLLELYPMFTGWRL
jgi:hypothetical protein